MTSVVFPSNEVVVHWDFVILHYYFLSFVHLEIQMCSQVIMFNVGPKGSVKIGLSMQQIASQDL